MAKKPWNTKEPNHRCRVDASILVTAEERSIRLGPGLVLSDEEYRRLIEQRLAAADWFEEIAGSEPEPEKEKE